MLSPQRRDGIDRRGVVDGELVLGSDMNITGMDVAEVVFVYGFVDAV